MQPTLVFNLIRLATSSRYQLLPQNVVYRSLTFFFLLRVKTNRGIYQANKGTRLAIMDPNNPANDISGGTKEIPLILDAFADSHRKLKDKLTSTATSMSTRKPHSLLAPIIGAYYESYEIQREHLLRLFHNDPRFAQYRHDSPPPPPPSVSPPPPPA